MAVAEKIENLRDLFNGHVNGKIVSHVITRLTAPGENFLSLILKVDVTVKNGEKEEILSTVAKLVPPSHLGGKMIGLDQVTFSNEIDWYEKVVPLFQEFEKEYAVEDITDIYPKYYGGRLNLKTDTDKINENAVVLLENLQDYKNGDRLTGFDLETSKEVLRALAKFHGLPIAFRHHKRTEFDEKVLPFTNRRPGGSGPPDDFSEPFLESLQDIPEFVPWIPRCKVAINNDPFKEPNYEYREPWATAIHDDFWTNNMMLKKTPGTPKVKVVDFQMVLFKSFAVDLIFFLLTSVESSVQKTKLDELIRYYYDQLIDILKQFRVDTDHFKYEDFLKELEIETKSGQYSHAIRFVNIVYKDRGTVPDVMMKMDEAVFKDIMSNRSPRVVEKQLLITKVCIERNWI